MATKSKAARSLNPSDPKKVNLIRPLGDQISLNKAFVVTNEISERRLENARVAVRGNAAPGGWSIGGQNPHLKTGVVGAGHGSEAATSGLRLPCLRCCYWTVTVPTDCGPHGSPRRRRGSTGRGRCGAPTGSRPGCPSSRRRETRGWSPYRGQPDLGRPKAHCRANPSTTPTRCRACRITLRGWASSSQPCCCCRNGALMWDRTRGGA